MGGRSLMQRLESCKRLEKQLDPCPFCGSDIINVYIQEDWYLVKCGVCSAQMRCFTKHLRQVKAEWNTRV